MHTHLRSMHNVNLCKRNADEETSGINTSNISEISSRASSSSCSEKKIQITEYFSDQIDTSLPAILSRMTASDGIPFSLFCTSNDLRMLLISKGHKEVPKSPNTIRKLVFEYGQKICKQITQEMKNVSANGFSLTWKILIIRF